MKLLIIAGPYEADRIRKTAVLAGFETVAVEPGESLSGWITASRPQLIVMAPQMVSPDPAIALAKVRSVPRGRVPIFLVGDEADVERMANLSEGFFVRPVSPEALLAHAKVVLAAERSREATTLGHEFSRSGRTPSSKSGPHGMMGGEASTPARPSAALRPLVTSSTVGSATAMMDAGRASGDANVLLAALDAGIDALMDAELTDALAASPRGSEPESDFGDDATTNLKVGGARRPLDDDRDGGAREGGAGDGGAGDGGARARILSRFALVEAGDYFQVLGVSRDATASELKSAHERVAREVAPNGLEAAVSEQLGVELEAIRMVTAEALRILTDDRLRTRYRAHLAT